MSARFFIPYSLLLLKNQECFRLDRAGRGPGPSAVLNGARSALPVRTLTGRRGSLQ